ncbi:MAG: ABC transporter ATP-binding protein [Flavobacteriaceae bacterium]
MLETKDLEVGYMSHKGKISVSKDISFRISEGEMAAIVGVNGIGKSTLLRTLGRVQSKLAGSITVNEIAIENYKSKDWAMELSVVLTDPLVSKNLTVQQLISLGRHPYTNWIGTLSGKDANKIQEAIKLVGLSKLSNKKCYELSDGQLQKVMIARALAQDTQIILLDEPTTHLDLYHKVQILKILQSIAHHTGKIVLYTTHEIDLAIQLCDKIMILEKRENFFGAPQELIKSERFSKLFPEDTIRFDPQSASFKVNK